VAKQRLIAESLLLNRYPKSQYICIDAVPLFNRAV
jgi:hypothetical protein